MSSSVRSDVRNALARHNVRNCRVLIAVSGGVDSITLLDAAAACAEDLALDIHIAHVDHGLRDDSIADAEAVKAEAAIRHIPFHTGRVNVRMRAEKTGSGIEAAARWLRYEFLTSTAQDIGASVVMTGHTADDAVETILMSIARAGSLQALSGIPAERILSDSVRVVRPLLETRRQDVVAYARERGLVWSEDVSNAESVFLRNRVRHELLPALTSVFGPGIGRNILRLGATMKDLAQIIEPQIDATEVLRHTNLGVQIGLSNLVDQPRVVIDTILRRELGMNTVDRDRIHDLTGAVVGSRSTLSGGRQALRERDHVAIITMSDAQPLAEGFEIDIINGETSSPYRLSEAWLHLQVVNAPVDTPLELPQGAIAIDFDAICGRLHCRPWQSGDRLRPRGMQGSKLVSDILTDAKIPHGRRSQVHVLADDEGILWICGLRQADRAVAGNGTIHALLCWVSNDATR